MSNREYDYLFKLVIIGDSGVGKSSVLLRFADDSFNESYLTTIGVDFRFKTLPIDGKNIKLQIWDTAGQERFRTITNAYYKGADGIVLVYDTTSQQSFESIDKFWLNEVESYAEQNVTLLLLGNKCDAADQKQVDTEKVQEYAEKKKMLFYETSAKNSDKVEDAFVQISKILMSKRDQELKRRKDEKKNKSGGNLSGNYSQSSSTHQSETNTSIGTNRSDQSYQTNHQPEKLVLNKPKKDDSGNDSKGFGQCCKM